MLKQVKIDKNVTSMAVTVVSSLQPFLTTSIPRKGSLPFSSSSVYTSRKIKDEIKVREDKPPLVSQQCVVCSSADLLCGTTAAELQN